MKDTGTTNNRQYLAFILAGGPGKSPFRQISCAVDAAGEIVFSRVLERYGEGGGGNNIHITGPGGNYEIWMGQGSEYVTIQFADTNADPVPPIPVTPAEVLESLRRWKTRPGVREIVTETGGAVVREYSPAVPADQ